MFLALPLALMIDGSIVQLPIEQYRLANGLEVILAPDPSDPLVAVSVRYRVGSMDDPRGRAGLAHLVEHLMFLEHDAARGNEFFARLESAGATDINAYTSLEHTEHHEIIAPEGLELALWLEAERMENLKGWVSADRLDAEKRVVANEFYERINDRPYAYAEQLLFERLFPGKHRLHFGPIGTLEQLDAITLDDVLAFHRDRIGPSTATLVLTGAIDPARARSLIEKHLGPVADNAKGRDVSYDAAPVLQSRPIFAPEWMAMKPLLSLMWRMPPRQEGGWKAIELLCSMLTYSRVSRAALANVKDESIEGLEARIMRTPVGDLFRVDAIAAIGVPPALARNRVQAMIETYLRVAPLDEEMTGTKRRMRLEFLRATASLPLRAALLQERNARTGDAKELLLLPGQWDKITSKEIQDELIKILSAEPQFAVAQPVRGAR